MSNPWDNDPVVAPASQVGKLNPADQTVLTEMQQDAEAKRTLAQRAGEFMAQQNQGGGTATGPGYGHINIPLIGDLGSPGQFFRSILDKATGDDQAQRLQTMDSIANQTWPLLRPAGQGRLLQTEADAFKKAFPSTQNYGTSNEDITKRLTSEAQQANARVNFVRQFIASGRGGVNEAAAAWQAQNSPQQQQAAALRARSAQTQQARQPQQPAQTGAVIDVFGRPVR